MASKQSEPTLPSRYNWKDHAGSKYQKRHYEDVAGILRYHVELKVPLERQKMASVLGAQFANLFAADNPNFDRERFLKACGLEEA